MGVEERLPSFLSFTFIFMRRTHVRRSGWIDNTSTPGISLFDQGPFGGPLRTESLILAQDERWRRA